MHHHQLDFISAMTEDGELLWASNAAVKLTNMLGLKRWEQLWVEIWRDRLEFRHFPGDRGRARDPFALRQGSAIVMPHRKGYDTFMEISPKNYKSPTTDYEGKPVYLRPNSVAELLQWLVWLQHTDLAVVFSERQEIPVPRTREEQESVVGVESLQGREHNTRGFLEGREDAASWGPEDEHAESVSGSAGDGEHETSVGKDSEVEGKESQSPSAVDRMLPLEGELLLFGRARHGGPSSSPQWTPQRFRLSVANGFEMLPRKKEGPARQTWDPKTVIVHGTGRHHDAPEGSGCFNVFAPDGSPLAYFCAPDKGTRAKWLEALRLLAQYNPDADGHPRPNGTPRDTAAAVARAGALPKGSRGRSTHSAAPSELVALDSTEASARLLAVPLPPEPWASVDEHARFLAEEKFVVGTLVARAGERIRDALDPSQQRVAADKEWFRRIAEWGNEDNDVTRNIRLMSFGSSDGGDGEPGHSVHPLTRWEREDLRQLEQSIAASDLTAADANLLQKRINRLSTASVAFAESRAHLANRSVSPTSGQEAFSPAEHGAESGGIRRRAHGRLGYGKMRHVSPGDRLFDNDDSWLREEEAEGEAEVVQDPVMSARGGGGGGPTVRLPMARQHPSPNSVSLGPAARRAMAELRSPASSHELPSRLSPSRALAMTAARREGARRLPNGAAPSPEYPLQAQQQPVNSEERLHAASSASSGRRRRLSPRRQPPHSPAAGHHERRRRPPQPAIREPALPWDDNADDSASSDGAEDGESVTNQGPTTKSAAPLPWEMEMDASATAETRVDGSGGMDDPVANPSELGRAELEAESSRSDADLSRVPKTGYAARAAARRRVNDPTASPSSHSRSGSPSRLHSRSPSQGAGGSSDVPPLKSSVSPDHGAQSTARKPRNPSLRITVASARKEGASSASSSSRRRPPPPFPATENSPAVFQTPDYQRLMEALGEDADDSATRQHLPEQSDVPPSRAASEEATVATGDWIELSDGRAGWVRYIGSVHFAEGPWIGLEVLQGCLGASAGVSGATAGSVGGVRYFALQCPSDETGTRPSEAAFVRPADVVSVNAEPNRSDLIGQSLAVASRAGTSRLEQLATASTPEEADLLAAEAAEATLREETVKSKAKKSSPSPRDARRRRNPAGRGGRRTGTSGVTEEERPRSPPPPPTPLRSPAGALSPARRSDASAAAEKGYAARARMHSHGSARKSAEKPWKQSPQPQQQQQQKGRGAGNRAKATRGRASGHSSRSQSPSKKQPEITGRPLYHGEQGPQRRSSPPRSTRAYPRYAAPTAASMGGQPKDSWLHQRQYGNTTKRHSPGKNKRMHPTSLEATASKEGRSNEVSPNGLRRTESVDSAEPEMWIWDDDEDDGVEYHAAPQTTPPHDRDTHRRQRSERRNDDATNPGLSGQKGGPGPPRHGGDSTAGEGVRAWLRALRCEHALPALLEIHRSRGPGSRGQPLSLESMAHWPAEALDQAGLAVGDRRTLSRALAVLRPAQQDDKGGERGAVQPKDALPAGGRDAATKSKSTDDMVSTMLARLQSHGSPTGKALSAQDIDALLGPDPAQLLDPASAASGGNAARSMRQETKNPSSRGLPASAATPASVARDASPAGTFASSASPESSPRRKPPPAPIVTAVTQPARRASPLREEVTGVAQATEKDEQDSSDEDVSEALGNWLIQLGCFHEAAAFAAANVTTLDAVHSLEEEDLHRMGIPEYEVGSLLEAIRGLRGGI